jgi:NADH:ubiquinone reductase (H+-translocating)
VARPGRHRVVVIGAGFAGLNVVKQLADQPVDVLVIDRHNYNTFQPLLYQVATAGLDPSDVAHSVRAVLRNQPNVECRMGTVVGVDADTKHVLVEGEDQIGYDTLVLAVGATTNYFGVQGAEEFGLPLYTLDHAAALRNHMLRCFERASVEPSLIDDGVLTFVIAGAGPTGVEMAGALAELFVWVLRHDYPEVDPGRARAILVETRPAVLASFHPQIQRYARETLESRGVELRLGETVRAVTRTRVRLASGAELHAHTLIWTAGVRASSLAQQLPFARDASGRIEVNDDLSVPDRPDVFAVGDLAAARGRDGRTLPQVAPVAIQSGHHVARQIARRLDGRRTRRFHYVDRGTMATIGRRSAVADLPLGIRLRGTLAWFAWLALHLVYLIGFRNRFLVLSKWAWNYLRWDWGPRLVLDPEGGDAPT